MSTGKKQAASTTQESAEVDPMDWEDSGAPETPSTQAEKVIKKKLSWHLYS
jgi:hypothetical protein